MKRCDILSLPEAIDDRDALYFYIAEETSFEAADRYLARIERLYMSLASFPKRGTAILGRPPGLRTMGFEGKATIVFQVCHDNVQILRILHHRRDVQRVLREMSER